MAQAAVHKIVINLAGYHFVWGSWFENKTSTGDPGSLYKVSKNTSRKPPGRLEEGLRNIQGSETRVSGEGSRGMILVPETVRLKAPQLLQAGHDLSAKRIIAVATA